MAPPRKRKTSSTKFGKSSRSGKKCLSCGSTFPKIDVLLEHMKYSQKCKHLIRECQFCHKSFTSEASLQSHQHQSESCSTFNHFVHNPDVLQFPASDKNTDNLSKGSGSKYAASSYTRNPRYHPSKSQRTGVDSFILNNVVPIPNVSDTSGPRFSKTLGSLHTEIDTRQRTNNSRNNNFTTHRQEQDRMRSQLWTSGTFVDSDESTVKDGKPSSLPMRTEGNVIRSIMFPSVGNDSNVSLPEENIEGTSPPVNGQEGVPADTNSSQEEMKEENFPNDDELDENHSQDEEEQIIDFDNNHSQDNEEPTSDENTLKFSPTTPSNFIHLRNEHVPDHIRMGRGRPLDLRPRVVDALKSIRFMDLSTECELPWVDLFLSLKGHSMSTYEECMKWHQKWTGSSSSLSRKKLIKRLETVVHGAVNSTLLQPKVKKIKLSSGMYVSMTTFSFSEHIVQQITDPSLFHADNLLLRRESLFTAPLDDGFLGDVNTGSWQQVAISTCDPDKKEIPLPLVFFIDGLMIDKFGKLECEAVLCSNMWLNRRARNRSSSWFVLGFLENLGRMNNDSRYTPRDKCQDYHDMLTHVFSEIKAISDSGGLMLTLDFNDGRGPIDIIAKPSIQFIIGDCKGNDILCGRMGSHGVGMQNLVRDCDVRPHDGDCPHHECYFRESDDMQRLILSGDAETQSFYSLTHNCFWELDFGGESGGIYGSTPLEVLHNISSGIVMYIAQSVSLRFPPSFHNIMDRFAKSIFIRCRRQSERDMPSLAAFRNGLTSVSRLTGEEKTARVFMLFLVFMQPEFIKDVHRPRNKYPFLSKRNGSDRNETAQPINRQILEKHLKIFEKTLCLHRWLKQSKISKEEIGVPGYGPADQAISDYMVMINNTLWATESTGFKTVKFHQLKHYTRYICKHGVPSNFDGGVPEHHGKEIIKDPAQKTNKNFLTLSHDIARRLYEERLVERACKIQAWKTPTIKGIANVRDPDLFPQNHFPSHSEVRIKRNDSTDTTEGEEDYAGGTKFSWTRIPSDIDSNESYDTHEDVAIRERFEFKWTSGKSAQSLSNISFDARLIQAINLRLFHYPTIYGGTVADPEATINGFCSYTDKNGVVYRAHPKFNKSGGWFDWAYFQWEGFDLPIVAEIQMMFDLSSTEISFVTEEDYDRDNDAVPFRQHLSKEKWCAVRAAKFPFVDPRSDLISGDNFESKIAYRTILEDEIRIVPMSAIVGPAYVIKNLASQLPKEDLENLGIPDMDDGTIMVVRPQSEWANHFIAT